MLSIFAPLPSLLTSFNRQVIDLTDIERLSLHTLTLLLINLPQLQVSTPSYENRSQRNNRQLLMAQILDHNHLHEALWLMHKTGMENR